MTSARRRLFAPVLLAGLAATGLTALAAGRPWAEDNARQEVAEGGVLIPEEVTGADAAPLVLPLALVALAAWGAVLVLRRRGRRLVAALGMVASGGAALAAALGVPAIQDVATVHPGQLPDDVAMTPWPWLALAAAVLSAIAFAAAWWAFPDWPEMSARYDAPTDGTRRTEPGADTDADGLDSRALWKALDEGDDPT